MFQHRRRLQWAAFAVAGLCLLVNLPGVRAEYPKSATESEARLRQDIFYLASDSCEGRGVTTAGIRRAADYIVGEFRKAGLKPGGVDGTYFQPFTCPGSVLEAPATFSIRGSKGEVVTYKQGVDFNPMGIGYAGQIENLPIVFVGYGISSEALPAYDDYAGIDVTDKVVVMLRDAPRPKATGKAAEVGTGSKTAPFCSGARRATFISLSRKVANAEKHHAAAVLLVNDAPTAGKDDELLDFNFTALAGGNSSIPVIQMHRSVLELMLAGGAGELHDIEHGIDEDLRPRSRVLTDCSASLTIKMKRGQIVMKNIIGVLEGKGALANEIVVIGAHYDHLGYGGPFGNYFFSSRISPKKMEIHYGADDNGSGTTSIMELARRFSAPAKGDRRRLVFMAFSGEEINLLGSAHYVNNPLFPMSDTVAMVNLDMVGRLSSDPMTRKDKLLVEGTGSAKNFDSLVERVNRKYHFTLVKKASGNGPSDHASFYGAGIPVIFCWNDIHPDYHTPNDTAERINIPGMRKIVDFAGDLISYLATTPERPQFVKVPEAPRDGGRLRLGIMPSYEDVSAPGMLVEDVIENGLASKGGMKIGDRVIEVDGIPVPNTEQYLRLMTGRKQEGTLDVVVVRGGRRMTLKIKLD
jgi:hypothetical protein